MNDSPDGLPASGGAPSADRWAHVQRIVDPALDLPPAERATYIARACGADTALRDEVARFLRSCDEASTWLEEPAARLVAPLLDAFEAGRPATASPGEGTRVGAYRLIREIGRGGMGTVHLAERADAQYRKRVALKIARGGVWLGGEEHLVHRFIEERQILAALEHPNIARLLDGGVTDDGLPWFAMEYVEGTPIDRYCDEGSLGIDERLALFCAVCDAVAFAHSNLVVHRDLKPSNILVTASGEVKLLDFGIAKLLAPVEPAPEAHPPTVTLFRALTPEYASPEQLRGERIATASDVYSLGVLVYELLAGIRPHVLPSRARPHQLERAILESDPARPSAAVGRVDGSADEIAARRRTTSAGLRRRLRGDLDTIVLTAIRREPERRYTTADRLAADVRRHLAAMPVSARPDTRAYRVTKFIRRHRVGVATAAAFALALVGFSVVTGVQAAQNRAQSRQLVLERDKARSVSDFLVGLFESANPFAGQRPETTVREVLAAGAARARNELGDQPELRAELLDVIGSTYHGLGMFPEARRLLEEAVALHPEEEAVAGEPRWIGATLRLAQTVEELGEYAEAESLYRTVLAERRHRLEPGHNHIARSLNSLAKSLFIQGRDAEAEPMTREALAIDRAGVGPERPRRVSQSLNNLGNILIARGDYAQAERLHREAHALRSVTLGDAHTETANSLVRIAVALRHLGRHAESETLLRQALAAKRVAMGATHLEIADDEIELAATLHTKGDLGAADSVYRRALAAQSAGRPGGHGRTAQALAGLGAVLLDRGAWTDAQQTLAAALEIQTRSLARGHWRTAETQRLLGVCLVRLGRYAEAEALIAESVATLRASRGEDDERTRRARAELLALGPHLTARGH